MLKYTFSYIRLLQLTEANCKINCGNLAFLLFKCDIVIFLFFYNCNKTVRVQRTHFLFGVDEVVLES